MNTTADKKSERRIRECIDISKNLLANPTHRATFSDVLDILLSFERLFLRDVARFYGVTPQELFAKVRQLGLPFERPSAADIATPLTVMLDKTTTQELLREIQTPQTWAMWDLLCEHARCKHGGRE